MVLRKVATHTPSEKRDADEAYEQNGCGDGSNHYRVLQRWSLTRIRPRSYIISLWDLFSRLQNFRRSGSYRVCTKGSLVHQMAAVRWMTQNIATLPMA